MSSLTKDATFSFSCMASASNHSRSKLIVSSSEIVVRPGPFFAIFTISRNKRSLTTNSKRSCMIREYDGLRGQTRGSEVVRMRPRRRCRRLIYSSFSLPEVHPFIQNAVLGFESRILSLDVRYRRLPAPSLDFEGAIRSRILQKSKGKHSYLGTG